MKVLAVACLTSNKPFGYSVDPDQEIINRIFLRIFTSASAAVYSFVSSVHVSKCSEALKPRD